MKTDGYGEEDARVLAEAQRIRTDKERSEKPSDQDIKILAEAKRIMNDEDRSESARKHMRGKGRAADVFAGEGSFAGKLKARREAVESGDLEGAPEVFIK
jgi:hypothetical protein